jgi:hypothetical protein
MQENGFVIDDGLRSWGGRYFYGIELLMGVFYADRRFANAFNNVGKVHAT